MLALNADVLNGEQKIISDKSILKQQSSVAVSSNPVLMTTAASPFKSKDDVHRHYADWIVIFYKLYYKTFLTPFLISFDKETGVYSCSKGSWRSKTGFWICHGIICIYSIWGCTISTMHANSPSATMNGIYKLSYFLFGLFNLVWLVYMWKQVPNVPRILNKGGDLFHALIEDDNHDAFSFEKMSRFARGPVVFVIVGASYISTFSFLVQGLPMSNQAHLRMSDMVNYTLNSFCGIHKFWCTMANEQFDDQQPISGAYIFTTVWVFIAFLAESSWQTVLLMQTAWALYFRKLLQLGLKRINNSNSNEEYFNAIQLFTKITLLLDELNQMIGTVLFINVVNVLQYKCITVANLMTNQMEPLTGLSSLMFTIIPYFGMLFFMADVHRVGCTVPAILKQKYILHKGQGDLLTLDVFHASVIFQNDVLANNTGFKGAGFFLVTFSFVGNLIGIITTYTLVTLQLTTVQ